jgi:hypothetical protein
MSRCNLCTSYAINPHMCGRTPGKHLDLCDVCYWRKEHRQQDDSQQLREVKRYWMQAGDGPGVYEVEDADGDWVPYEDYEREVRVAIAAGIRMQDDNQRLREAIQAAIDCGMVPNSSAKEGGASRFARQVVVADMLRAALTTANGEVKE